MGKTHDNKSITPWKGSWAQQMEKQKTQDMLEFSHAHELINHSNPERKDHDPRGN